MCAQCRGRRIDARGHAIKLGTDPDKLQILLANAVGLQQAPIRKLRMRQRLGHRPDRPCGNALRCQSFNPLMGGGRGKGRLQFGGQGGSIGQSVSFGRQSVDPAPGPGCR